MKKAKRKRSIKDGEQDGSRTSDQLSSQVKVARSATRCIVKEEITAEVNVVVNKPLSTKRKRASSMDVNESVQSQVDSKMMCDTLPSRRRKAAMTSVQNDKPLQQDKRGGHSVNERKPSGKQRQFTQKKKSASEVEEKEDNTAELGTAAVSNQNHEHKRSSTKRKRASPADVPESVPSQVNSEILYTLPSRRREIAVQNSKLLQQDKYTGQSVNKRQHSVKQRQSTRMRKSSSEAQVKKASEEPLQKVSDVDRKKSTKVKRESASPVQTVDNTSVKTEKPDVSFTSAPHHSSRKFIGAHVSISGM